MKVIGVVRRIDDLGRLVIPKEIRKANGWPNGTPMEFFMEEDKLIIKKYAVSEEVANLIELLQSLEKNSGDKQTRYIAKKAIEFIEGR